jgi:hypothetical protein
MTGSAYLPKMADLRNEAGEHRTGRVLGTLSAL